MATISTIRLRIEATAEGIRDAARDVEAQLGRMRDAVERNQSAFDRVGRAIAASLTGLAAIGSLTGAVTAVVGLTASLTNLIPAALILPGLIAGLGVAFATFKLATSGFADALGGDTEALARLAPAARETVGAINALKPAFDNLRQSVQQEFFQNFAGDVQAIGGRYLPTLQRLLPQVAQGFNAMGRSVTRAALDSLSFVAVNDIIRNTIGFLGNARNALGSFVAGFLPLAAVGSSYLPAIGTALDSIADKFRIWVRNGLADGSIREAIDQALAGFRDLGTVIANIGGIVTAVFTGMSQDGQDFLTVLAAGTGELRAFLETAGAQEALGALGAALAAIATVVREVFIAALQALAPVIVELAPVVAAVAETIGDTLVNAIEIVSPLLLGLAGFLNQNRDAVALLAPILLGLWAAFAGARIITTVLTGLRAFTLAVGGLGNILRGGAIIAVGALAIELDKINQKTAELEGRDLTSFEDSLSDLVGAGQQIVTLDFAGILADIGAELDVVRTGFEQGTSPIGAFVARLQEAVAVTGESFATIGTTVATFFGGFVARLQEAVAVTGESFATIGTTVTAFFTETIPAAFTEAGAGIATFFTQTIPDTVRAGLDAVIAYVTGWVGTLGAALTAGAETAGTGFATTIRARLDEAIAYVAAIPGRAGAALAGLVESLRAQSAAAGAAVVATLTERLTAAVAYVQGVPARASAAVAALTALFRARAAEATAAFQAAVVAGFNAVVAFAQSIPGRLVAAIGNLGGRLVAQGRALMDGLGQGIRAGYESLRSFVGGIADGLAAVKGPLSYDRRVMTPAGLALMDGLLHGIRTGYGEVARFTAGIADDLAASLPGTGRRAAARELLDRIASGGAVFEDLSFRGQSANLGANNDQLADEFRAGGGRDLRGFLERIAAGIGEPSQVRVYIGERELVDIVRTEVDTKDDETVTRARAGVGAEW